MSTRTVILVLVGLALLAGGAGRAAAQAARTQSEYERKAEEYNAYQDIVNSKTPPDRLQACDAFLKAYPQSQYLPFVYPLMTDAAFQAQKYGRALESADSFLKLDREQVTAAYKQSNYTEVQIDNLYFSATVLYTYSLLHSVREGSPQFDELADRAAQIARQGLELHAKLYAQVQPPADPAQREQFEQLKRQQETSFHALIAAIAYRKKDYATAATQYALLLASNPSDPAINYRLGLANLQKEPRDAPRAFWHLARAIDVGVAKADDVKEYLTKTVAAYQGVYAQCAAREVDRLLVRAKDSPTPPADWHLFTPEQIAEVREGLSPKRIYDELKAGGDQEEMIWLASCGAELPEIEAQVLEVAPNDDNGVTLHVAITQESADAGKPDAEVRVVAPPEAKNIKAGDIVRFTSILHDYVQQPAFELKLSEAKVNPEDIPKTRGRGGAGAR